MGKTLKFMDFFEIGGVTSSTYSSLKKPIPYRKIRGQDRFYERNLQGIQFIYKTWMVERAFFWLKTLPLIIDALGCIAFIWNELAVLELFYTWIRSLVR
jgi:hypothetical protein